MTKTEERIFVDAYENTRRNLEYTKRIEKIIELGRKIMKCLGPYRLLFLEYERLVGLYEGVYIENVYRIGLEDGQKLSQKVI